MIIEFYNVFYYSCLIISTLIGIFYFNKVEPPFKWLAILMLVTLISEGIAKYIAFGMGKTNNEVYHIFTPVEYILYLFIFSGFLNLKKWNAMLWVSAAGLVLLEIINTIFFQPLEVMNTNTIIAENILLVFLSLVMFLRIRETPFRQDLLQEGVFWFNSAVLCYYAYNIMISGLQSMKVYLLDNPPLVIYDFNLLWSGLLYLTYAAAIRLSASNRKQILVQHD
jgi:hypothetical protein